MSPGEQPVAAPRWWDGTIGFVLGAMFFGPRPVFWLALGLLIALSAWQRLRRSSARS